MPIQYNTISIENLAVIREKAKLKKDGCYTLRGLVYRVRNNIVTHISERFNVYELYGHFMVDIGKYSEKSFKNL